MNKECKDCDYNRGACFCSPYDKWYACPIESSKPENQQALREYAEQRDKMSNMTCKEMNEWAKTFMDGFMKGMEDAEEPDECVDGEAPNTPEVNLYEVELMLERLIERDLEDPYIKKPITHALYLVWKWADENERSRDDVRAK